MLASFAGGSLNVSRIFTLSFLVPSASPSRGGLLSCYGGQQSERVHGAPPTDTFADAISVEWARAGLSAAAMFALSVEPICYEQRLRVGSRILGNMRVVAFGCAWCARRPAKDHVHHTCCFHMETSAPYEASIGVAEGLRFWVGVTLAGLNKGACDYRGDRRRVR